MQGEKSKSMTPRPTTAKGGKDMKAEGRDNKTGTTNAKAARARADSKNAQTNGADRQQVRDHDRQRRDVGDRRAAAREAHPDRLRDQVGEDPGNHQRELQRSRSAPACPRRCTSTRFRPGSSTIYPEWRGYEVILVHGRYVIVRPQTHEIVYIIEG